MFVLIMFYPILKINIRYIYSIIIIRIHICTDRVPPMLCYLTPVPCLRSTIINLFRVPLNVITILVLLGIKSALIQGRGLVFSITSLLVSIASFLAYSVAKHEEKTKVE